MWFLIGSRAIKAIDNDFYRNIEKSDLDLYCSKEDFTTFINQSLLLEQCFPLKKNKYRLKIKGFPIVELKIYTEDSVYSWLSKIEQKELVISTTYKLENINIAIPNLKCLQFIKQSHLYWPIHWFKNIEDFTWLKEKTKDLHITLKEYEFKQRIKKEMKSLHGTIPHGTINNIPINYEKLLKQCPVMDNKKKIAYFIHESLSLKQKLRIIHNWNNYKYLIQDNAKVQKMKHSN